MIVRSDEDAFSSKRKAGEKVCVLLCLVLIAIWPTVSLQAQQPMNVPRIGFLITSSPSAIAPRMDMFLQGLHDHGYIEGKNIIIERRFANGNSDQLAALAAELVRLNVDMIVTSGPTATRPAKDATSKIPIVMTFDDDPVGSGFVLSLSRPGRNITGLSTLSPEISGKQLQLLKETVPKLSRVAVIGTASRQGTEQILNEIQPAAPPSLQSFTIWTYQKRKRLRVCSAPLAKSTLMHCSYYRVLFLTLIENVLQIWRLSTDSPPAIPGGNSSKMVV